MNKATQDIKNIWSNLGTNQKISLFAAILFIAGISAGLLAWSSQADMQLLYGRLEGKDMSEVVALLEEKGVPYEVKSGGGAIYVPSDKIYAVRMELAAKGVPHGGNVGFEIFDQSNFGISDFVQRTNYLRAIQGELSRTITQLKGVKTARVMVVVPENKLLAEAHQTKPTASVFIDTGGLVVGQEAVNSIRFLVASAVEGLNINDVAVVDNHGNTLSEDLRSQGSFGFASSQMKFQESVESYYAKKVETMLTKIVGAGNVVARVSVDIDRDKFSKIEEIFDPESQVVRSQVTNENTASSQKNDASKTAGVQANTPGGAGESNGALASTEELKKSKTISYEINKAKTELVRAPGNIKEITAAVFIAPKKDLTNPEAAATPRTPEEMQTIRIMVANTLGLSQNDIAANKITVEEVAFHTPLIEEESSLASISSPLMQYVSLGKNFFAVGLSIIMFFIFLRMIKKHQPQSLSVELLSDNSTSGNNAKSVSANPTPELLNELIQQKPENISNALKNWVNNTPQQ